MQYYQTLIYVHRPFLSEGGFPAGPSSRGRRMPSREICIEAAFSISALVRNYERTYTLRRINIQAVSIIFSAALLLLFASLSSSQHHDQDDLLDNLSVCSDALAEIGEYYQLASRSLDLLFMIKREWKARMISGPVNKRPHPTQSHGMGPHSKVARTDSRVSLNNDPIHGDNSRGDRAAVDLAFYDAALPSFGPVEHS